MKMQNTEVSFQTSFSAQVCKEKELNNFLSPQVNYILILNVRVRICGEIVYLNTRSVRKVTYFTLKL